MFFHKRRGTAIKVPGSGVFSGSALVYQIFQSLGYCSNDVTTPWKLGSLAIKQTKDICAINLELEKLVVKFRLRLLVQQNEPHACDFRSETFCVVHCQRLDINRSIICSANLFAKHIKFEQ